MGDVLYLQGSIGGVRRYAGGKYQVKHIAKQASKVELQAKEKMGKVNSRSLTETASIKEEVQSTIALVKNIYQGQRRPIKTLKDEVESLKRGIINAPRLDQWSEDMDSELMPVLELLGERMKHLDINNRTVVGGVDIGMSKIAALHDKWEVELNEVAARIYGMAFFPDGRVPGHVWSVWTLRKITYQWDSSSGSLT